MSHLVIDIGNSRTKVAIFDDHKLIRKDVLVHLSEEVLADYLKEYAIQQSIISSVKDEIKGLENLLANQTNYIRFSSKLNTGVINEYRSPETLGLDRLAGVIGARALFHGKNVLAIDLGTCITYDAISKKGIYRGGSISPGLNTRV